MPNSISNILSKLQAKDYLSLEESYQMQSLILQDKIEEEQIIKIFEAFEIRKESGKDFVEESEMLGIVKASRENMLKITTKFDTMDIVGTGGDRLNTFNISTLTALVVASSGVFVAKHGNRSSSSQCGSADVLEHFGVKIDLNSQQAYDCLQKTGFVFCFAKNFNPAFRFVANSRKIFKRKTYFNFLGPLLNPTNPKFMLLGLSDFDLSSVIAKTLSKNDIKKAWLVQSEEGMDEISTFSSTKILEINNQKTQTLSLNQKLVELQILPDQLIRDLNLVNSSLAQIQSQSHDQNLEIFENVLENEATKAQTEIVLVNSAASLVICQKVKDLEEGFLLAKELLESGKVKRKFEEVINFFA